MTILLFGITKDIVGQPTLSLSHSEAQGLHTAGELKEFLKDNYPDMKKLSSLAVAVNSEYAQDEHAIKEEDEIAIIPPVSGG
ncbi:MoaD/ThiS family protein [Lentiprolixibacter aurantiacus]|uniref:Molybdopterin synthase sulfur carrier subunit n=1 Tax=Lentiprolixibacter aurantiacus TaxID=2993939 RepID=A0AAE3MKT8_9FLAO|nr:MoaD/ThiS family protein [Lentiprolixibacter aurantiacus]MCX2719600.1 MoaD/ThiS family protein [Lentiprolixibacter aurantiacus]